MARRLRTSSRFGCFSFTVQPMASRQLSMPNVADIDVLLGSVPCFLSCLSANGPTARPFGTMLQALDFSGLHSVKHVFLSFLLTLVPRLYLPLWLPSHPSAQRLRPSCFRWPIATRYPFSSCHGCELHHRVVYLAMRHFSLIIMRCGGIYSLIFVFLNSRIFDPLSNSGCFVDIL